MREAGSGRYVVSRRSDRRSPRRGSMSKGSHSERIFGLIACLCAGSMHSFLDRAAWIALLDAPGNLRQTGAEPALHARVM